MAFKATHGNADFCDVRRGIMETQHEETQKYSRRSVFSLGLARLFQSVEQVARETQKMKSQARSFSWNISKTPPLWIRPPGALPEKEFLKKCTGCMDCIKACPHYVIRRAGAELGTSIQETPILLPHENPCLLCADFPCIKSCTTGALVPFEGKARLGLAVVQEEKCYSSQGQPCEYCRTICPEKPKAIVISQRGQAAQVQTDSCTGCGKCVQLCPAQAIWIQDGRKK
jgi:ferredoxin-type protein NapG